MDHAMYNSVNLAIAPNHILSFGPPMDFKQRFANTALHATLRLLNSFLVYPRIEEASKELLGLDETPDLINISLNEVSLSLVQGHPLLEANVPKEPNTAWVAGLQTRPAKSIEDGEVKAWLDEAEHGVIYVSFGTVT